MARRTTLKRILAAVSLLAGLVLTTNIGTSESAPPQPTAAAAHDSWQKEMDDVCSTTQDAMTFSQVELATLVQRCDALLPQVGKLDETRKRVYMRRLQMCRGLYAYILESKRNERK